MKTGSAERVRREVGRRVRQARLAAGLSQQRAAQRGGIDYKRWQTIEKGAANVTITTLHRIAATLGLDFWDLMQAPSRSDPPALRRGRRRLL